jgi:hypothetical protein
MTKTRAERETIICRAQDEATWRVFSEVPAVVRKLTRLHGAGKPKGAGFVWEVPPSGVSFRNTSKRPTDSPRKGNDRLARWREQQAAGKVTP